MKKLLAFVFFVSFSANAQNTLTVFPVPSGQRPSIRSDCPADINCYAELWYKGEGAFVVRGWDGGAHAFIASSESINGQNFLGAYGTIGPPTLRALGPGTDVSLLLEPQNSGVVMARNAVEIVTIASDGTRTTLGYFGRHAAIFGGTSNDLVLRVEPGARLRFFIGGAETTADGVFK